MKLTSVRIQNYRGLKDVKVPLSQFGCLIGENNSGKSSVLQAVLLLLPSSSKKPLVSDFFDGSKPIRIELQVDEIEPVDLDRISNPQHRASFAPDVVEGSVTFVRAVDQGESIKSQLLISRLGPKDPRWTDEELAPLMKGKLGADLRAVVVAVLPELDGSLSAKPNQTEVKTARDVAVLALPLTEKTYRDEPLGTGLDAGIKNFLPEPIYIEAVKDVADEIKTADTATFGKLLGILLDEVQDQFADVEQQFKSIQKQLSRVIGDDGVIVDERINEVRLIENMINQFVKQSFPDVELTISVPVPKMKTILSSAEISANDGHEGPIVSKGDGLKRAVAFAILRAYTALRSSGIANSAAATGHYWLLFEEPELYLYPRAQRQLFKALDIFSKDYPVMVTTHSPIFFDADTTQSFVKFSKVRPGDSSTPFSEVHPIVLGDDLPIKTAFQIICHENNSIGFFAKEVVLVEGDSDVLLFTHIAKLLDPAWDAVERNIAFARTNGKGNIANYRTFFGKFDIPVHVLCDLDALVGGFDKLDPTEGDRVARAELLQLVDGLGSTGELTQGGANALSKSGEARSLWLRAVTAKSGLDGSDAAFDALTESVDAFFAYSKKDDRLEALKTATGEIAEKKLELINSLRQMRTNVLSRGAIEDYYASASKSHDKVKQAISYCANCDTIEKFRADLGDDAAVIEDELRLIMIGIFGQPAAQFLVESSPA